MKIEDLKIGQRAVIKAVGGEGNVRGHLLGMGFIPGAELELAKKAPMGDPLEITLHGYTISVRKAEVEEIDVQAEPHCASCIKGSCCASYGDCLKCAEWTYRTAGGRNAVEGKDCGTIAVDENYAYNDALHEHNSHPGLGEAGRFHNVKEAPAPVKRGGLKFALAGQQNSGKTTLFNLLTGSNRHVGNFPGVTLERKDGGIKDYPQITITDLPGIYSLSTFSSEEQVSRDFLLKEKPDCIINIVDAGNIERNLYLTIQLMELEIPMVLALNMMDEVLGNGGQVRVNEMERLLGIPVVAVSATRNEGVDELLEHAIHIARYNEKPLPRDFCNKSSEKGAAVHRCIHGIMHLVEDHAQKAGFPVRFAAGRIIEGDKSLIQALGLDANELEMIEHIIVQMEQEHGMDRHAAMADMRFAFIGSLCSVTVSRPKESREMLRSTKIDRVLTGKWSAIPIFIAVFALTLYLTIDVLGGPLQQWLEGCISACGEMVGSWMLSVQVSEPIRSFIVDGIFGGVGFVLSFVPIIILLFFFLSMLEDSGYMSRVAFITDKLLRHVGLSGRSIVPLVIGFGCSVPAIMASRTLPSSRDRKLTVFLIPFMSCSAKIPVYTFLCSAFFPGRGGLVMAVLYLLAIVTGILIAIATRRFAGRSSATPFIMEMPNYRLPKLMNVAHLLYDRLKDFLRNAFTLILVATIVIWFLRSYDFHLNFIGESPAAEQASILAYIAGWIAPLFAPVGLGDWRIVVALISGFLAKESVVSSLEVLGATAFLTQLTAVPLLVFCLLYTPCIASITAVKREFGWLWALGMVLFQCILAWIVAYLSFLLASALGF